jgi:hypothetical protein
MAIYTLSAKLFPGVDLRLQIPRCTGAQIVTISGSGLGGTFLLAYKSASTVTAPIPYNATAAQVRSALEVLPGLGVGSLLVTGSAGGPWTIAPVHPLDPDTFLTPLLGYNLAALTGTSVSISVTREAINITGYLYTLAARSHPPLPSTPDILMDASHTTQGTFTNHGATGLLDIVILGSAIKLLDFTYGGNNNVTATYDLIEFDGTYYNLILTGTLELQAKVEP